MIPLQRPMTIVHASGSAGVPRAVLHTCGNHYYNALGSNVNLPYSTRRTHMNITDISGIGDATAQRLKAHGIDSVEAVAQASIEQLAAVPGISASRAAALGESARGLLPDASADAESAEERPAPAGDAEEGSETAAAPDDDGAKAKRKKDGKKGKAKKDKKKKGKAGKKKEKKKRGRKKGKGGKKKKNKRK